MRPIKWSGRYCLVRPFTLLWPDLQVSMLTLKLSGSYVSEDRNVWEDMRGFGRAIADVQ